MRAVECLRSWNLQGIHCKRESCTEGTLQKSVWSFIVDPWPRAGLHTCKVRFSEAQQRFPAVRLKAE